MQEAEQTRLPDQVAFVQGIRWDFASVAGALEFGWCPGVSKGQINSLKTIKRQGA
jgi:transposase